MSPTQMAEVEGKRTDLWGAAYEQIQKEDPKLLVAYKKYLLALDQGMSILSGWPESLLYRLEGRLPLF
jgi:hypothetical protein